MASPLVSALDICSTRERSRVARRLELATRDERLNAEAECVLANERYKSVVGRCFTPCTLPQNEINALVALFESTQGYSWFRRDGWVGRGAARDIVEVPPFEVDVTVWHGLVFEDQRLTAIHLPCNGLSGTLLHSIAALSQLRILNVKRNALRSSDSDKGNTILTALMNLPALTQLDLSQNQIQTEIPADFFLSLANLKTLDISNNQLFGPIPSDLPSSLTELHLGLNKTLQGPPPHLTKTLVKLVLPQNSICTKQFNLISFESLRSLDIASNKLSCQLPHDNWPPCLQHLALDHNCLQGVLPKSLFSLTALLTLFLNNNTLEGKIPDSLHTLPCLKQANFSSNRFSGLAPSQVPSSLKCLDLSNNPHLRSGDTASLLNASFIDYAGPDGPESYSFSRPRRFDPERFRLETKFELQHSPSSFRLMNSSKLPNANINRTTMQRRLSEAAAYSSSTV